MDSNNRLNRVLAFGIIILLVCVIFAGIPLNVNADPSNNNVIFEDDFSSNLSKWNLWGSPLPYIDSNYGNPSPSMQINGDANYNSGADSIQTFDYTKNFIFEADMRIAYTGIHYYDTAIALPKTLGNQANDAQLAIWLWGWEGTVRYSVNNDYYKESIDTNWHSYKIVILSDLRVEFYFDGNLKWTSTNTIDLNYNNMPITIFGRNGWVDNVKVTSTETQQPPPLPYDFEDDFSLGLGKWNLWGSPLPYIDNVIGNPSPSFQCNGDSLYNSGGDTKQRFDISNGLIMEADMRIVNPGVHFNDAAFGLTVTEQNQATTWSIGVWLWGWDKSFDLRTNKESTKLYNLDDKWHSYKIIIAPDMECEFYIDGELKWTAQHDLTYNNKPFAIWGRRGWIDNVKIKTSVEPIDSDDDGISDADEDKLAEEYMPTFYFVNDEKCFPTTIEYHLELSDRITILGEDYLDNKFGTAKEDDSRIIDDYYEVSPVEDQNSKYPYTTYVHVTKDEDEYSGKEYIIIQYWLFYAFNYGFNRHEGDWEMVQVVLDMDENPLFAAYSQHYNGELQLWDFIEDDNGHPIVYVALGSHASYFDTGRHWKSSYGFDVTSTDIELKYDEIQYVRLGEIDNHPSDQNLLFEDVHWGEFYPKPFWSGPPGPSHRKSGFIFKIEMWKDPLKWAKDLSDPYNVKVYLDCPANMTITDENSNITGYSNGQLVNEILGANIFFIGEAEAYSLPPDQNYTYSVRGYDDGVYNLSISNGSVKGLDFIAQEIPISVNETHQYIIDWDFLNQSENGVAIKIDKNGDSTFDFFTFENNSFTLNEYNDVIYDPWAIKLNAITELESLKGVDLCLNKKIDSIIKSIEKSLDKDFWLDEKHLDSKHGYRVFLNELIAIAKMKFIGKYSDISFDSAINKLVKADKILAIIAYEDAEAMEIMCSKNQKKVDFWLDKADKQMTKAENKFEDELYVLAITNYMLAWKFSQFAIKWARKECKGKKCGRDG